ncbi:MAG: AMP-binding protein, partial [Acaryochloris sp. CRU_2_0]|nr:AMP-binding protein [Acaryochloris sp. CRU_2_0]
AETWIVPTVVAKDSVQLQRLLDTNQVTVMQATPTTWQMLLAAGWSSRETSMTLLCGGEALSSEIASYLLRPGQVLWNLYGLAETTIWSTCYRVTLPSLTNKTISNQTIPIGQPIANTQTYILDAHLQPVPIGVVGELYIGGTGLARGYRNRPDLTAEKFIANPFGAGRLYRTGDLACYRPNGNIEILGHLHHQVQLEGHRIDLDEIDAVLSAHEQIQHCIVTTYNEHSNSLRVLPPPSCYGNGLKLAITATFTAEPLTDSLQFWQQQLEPELEWWMEFAPYNQVFQQLLDPSSLLRQNQRGINVVLVRLEDWIRYDNAMDFHSVSPSLSNSQQILLKP